MEPLSDIEALLWGLEGGDGPLRRAVITIVAHLDASPGIGRLRARAETVTTHLPRMRQRVVGGLGPFAGTPLRWCDADGFDVADHVRPAPARPAGARGHQAASEPPSERGTSAPGRAGVLRRVETATTIGMPRDRPPWDMTLVEDVGGDGEAALVIRLHHVCTDGVGALRLAGVLFDLAPDASGPAALPTRPAVRAGWGLGASLGLGWARRTWPAVAAHARDVIAAPEARAQTTVDLLRSLSRLADPRPRALSPVMTKRSVATGMGTLDLDLAGMAARGRAAGGTVNDVFVAGVLAGLQRYHAVHGRRPHALRLGVPINMRTDATPDDVSNALAAARITAPLQIADASARITAVHRLILRERHQPANHLLGPLAGVVNRVPGVRPAMGTALASLDVMASNVPGPPVPLWLGGARLLALYPFGPRSGAALNLTLLSHEGTARVGVHLDPAATPDARVLLDCLGDGFAATLG